MVLVVVGVVINQAGKVLIAKRPEEKHLGGYWEFPGGKVEMDESIFAALKREFKEEVNIEILKGEPLVKISQNYDNQPFLLDVWKVSDFTGEAKGMEGQPIRWVNTNQLQQYAFPEVNQKIFEYIM